MPHRYFETDRLIVRQWVRDDIPALLDIMSDSRVHTYTGNNPWSLEHVEKYIQFMLDSNFQTLDWFHGACILKETKQLVGITGLNRYLPKQPELEWQFGVPFWGNGYATEVGRAAIRGAFEATDITCIYGMANPDNKASMKALENIGMTCIGLHEFHGRTDVFYRISRDAFH